MVVARQMRRLVLAESSYRRAHRLKQILVLADYDARCLFEAIEANELLDTLRQTSPIHAVVLTPSMISSLEQKGLQDILRDEFNDVALLYLAAEAGQERLRSKLIPDQVIVPPVTADSFDEAVTAAMQSRENRLHAAQYIAAGETDMAQGLLAQAQAKFEAAVELGGLDPYPSYVLGGLFATLGKSEPAIAYFAQAWEKDPSFIEAVYRLVELLLSCGERTRAIAYLERVVSQGVADVDSLVMLATLHIETDAIDDGRTSLKRACSLDVPRVIGCVQEQTQRLLQHNATNTAIALLDIAIDLLPEIPQIYGLLGDLYLQQDRAREALVCYENLSRCGNPLPSNYCRLARVYMALGFNLRAEKAVQSALHLDPKCAEAADLLVAVSG